MYVWVSYDPVPNVTKPPFKSLKSCYISIKPSTCTLFVSVQRILQSSPNNEQGSPAKGKIQGPRSRYFSRWGAYIERERVVVHNSVYITRLQDGIKAAVLAAGESSNSANAWEILLKRKAKSPRSPADTSDKAKGSCNQKPDGDPGVQGKSLPNLIPPVSLIRS